MIERCGNRACQCELEEGQEFCSAYCESQAGAVVPAEPCQCGHPVCVEASYP